MYGVGGDDDGDATGTFWDRVAESRSRRDCMCYLGPPTTLVADSVGMRKSPDLSPRRLSDISPQLRQLKYLVVDESIKEDQLRSSRSVEDINSASIEERILRITGYYGYQPWNTYNSTPAQQQLLTMNPLEPTGNSTLEGEPTHQCQENSEVSRPHSSQQPTKTLTRPEAKRRRPTDAAERTTHICKQCDKSFSRTSHLKSHQRIHTGEKPFNCTQCAKSFSLLGNLKTHQRIHTGEKPFSCKQCDRSFNQVVTLKSHQRVHTGEKPFHCKQCGKSFTEIGTLKRHKRVHTGEKPYPCKQCDKRFSHLGSLKTHQHIHTGEKTKRCDKKSSSLKTHQLIHTGEKPFPCKQCDKRYSKLGSLKRHQRIHTGEKPKTV